MICGEPFGNANRLSRGEYGRFSKISIVPGSVAEIESRKAQGVRPRGDSLPHRCSEATTSSAFIVLPSWNGTALRSLMT
jgi:hypothetical protein